MSVKVLKEILEEIDIAIMMEVVECIWSRDGFDFSWNTDDDEDDLENGDGNTYSVEVRGGVAEYDGYLVLNADTGCGETVTYLFNLSKEVEL